MVYEEFRQIKDAILAQTLGARSTFILKNWLSCSNYRTKNNVRLGLMKSYLLVRLSQRLHAARGLGPCELGLGFFLSWKRDAVSREI